MDKRKVQNDKQRSTKHTHKTKDIFYNSDIYSPIYGYGGHGIVLYSVHISTNYNRIHIYFNYISVDKLWHISYVYCNRGCRGRDRMVVGFITTYEISAYYHYRCEYESRSGEVHSI